MDSRISPKICVTCKIFVVKSNLTCFLGWERNSIFSSNPICRNRLAPFWFIYTLVVWHKQLPFFNSNNHTPHVFLFFSPILHLAFHGLVSCLFRCVQYWKRTSMSKSEPYLSLNRNMDTYTSPSCRNQNLSLERSRSQCNE